MDGFAAMADTTFLASALNDPTKHAQVLQYVEAMKSDESGWKKSIENIVGNTLSSAEEYFIMLQVIEDYVTTRYCTSDESASLLIKQLLSYCMERIRNDNLPSFLVNKMAQVFALVFAVDFPIRWPNFMQEVFFNGNMDDSRVAHFYLKTLVAIDSEVVDRDIQRAAEIFDRNTKIKDGMRDLCINDCVRSWHHILTRSDDIVLQSLCLDVIAVYVDWIDIELVANEEFVPLLVQRLSHKDTTEAAQRAVVAVVSKKMIPSKKLSLVMAISQVMHQHKLLEITNESDEDDLLRIGTLMSALGLTIIDSYIRLRKERDEENESLAIGALSLLEGEICTLLVLLDSTYEEVSLSVAELVKAYVALLLQKESNESTTILSQIVSACLRRYEFPSDLNIDGTGEDEADFHEYRKEIRQIIHSVSLKRPELLIEPLELAIDSVGDGNISLGKRESIVHLIFSLSELLPNGLLNAKGGWLERASRLPIRLISILSPQSPSTALTLLFFETASRYERLLARDSSCILSLVSHFIGDYGMAHSSPSVRSRVIYLFSRFVKSQRALLSKVVPEVIVRVAPLLQSCHESSSFLSNEDQGYLLEATATIIVHSELTPHNKAQYMTELATTIATTFNKQLTLLNELEGNGGLTEKLKEDISQILCANINFATKLSKAFGLSGKDKNLKECGCVNVFIDILNLFCSSLFPSRSFLVENTRQLAGRLLVCVDEEIFPSLSLLLSRLSSMSIDYDSMQHLVILTQQIVQKHKNGILSSGMNISSILSSSCRLSCQSIPQSTVPSDMDRRSQMYLKRSLMSLLLTLLQNDILAHVTNATESEEILECTSRLSIDNDATTQKAAVTVLSKVAMQGGGQIMERILHTVLCVPMIPHFSFKDAGSALVMHEVINCLHQCYNLNQSIVSNVISTLFPNDFSQQMVNALSTIHGKDLDRALTLLYTQIRES